MLLLGKSTSGSKKPDKLIFIFFAELGRANKGIDRQKIVIVVPQTLCAGHVSSSCLIRRIALNVHSLVRSEGRLNIYVWFALYRRYSKRPTKGVQWYTTSPFYAPAVV